MPLVGPLLKDNYGGKKPMRIAQVNDSDRSKYRPLLLLGDEDPVMLEQYLHSGSLFAAWTEPDAVVAGVMLLTATDHPQTIELRNIAVAPEHQRHGVGMQLIACGIDYARKQGMQRMIVGTGDADVQNQLFYLKNGFRYDSIRRDFFKQYAEPIFANGVQLRDMVVLERTL
jgi:GNAT superfamily N-acetyltransferase